MGRAYYASWRGAIALALLCTAFGGARQAIAQSVGADSSGTLVVIVTARDAGPLGYSVVSAPALSRELFTNDRGVATLTKVAAGRVQLRVRHLGYTAVDVGAVVHAGRTDSVRVQMAHVAVGLKAVRVRALSSCTSPGPPSAASDPGFAAVFEQLRENADQYRLVADAYPFAYSMERMSTIHYVGGDSIIQSLDTLVLGTGVKWHYAIGSLITESEDPKNRQVLFNIPALIHFAEQSFLSNHCFASGGLDSVDGHPMIRVDFAAASRIKAPDVDGSMFLDPKTFQIRRSVLRLTRIPERTPQISAVEVVTDFREVLPSIPLLAEMRSIHTLFADPTRPVLPDAVHETQRLLRVTFLKGRPGESPPRP